MKNLKHKLAKGLAALLVGVCAVPMAVSATEDTGSASDESGYSDEAVLMIGGSCEFTENGYELPVTITNTAPYDFDLEIRNLSDKEGNAIGIESGSAFHVEADAVIEDKIILSEEISVAYGHAVVVLDGEDMSDAYLQFGPRVDASVILYLQGKPDGTTVVSSSEPGCKTCGTDGAKAADTSALNENAGLTYREEGLPVAAWAGIGAACVAVLAGGVWLYFKKIKC